MSEIWPKNMYQNVQHAKLWLTHSFLRLGNALVCCCCWQKLTGWRTRATALLAAADGSKKSGVWFIPPICYIYLNWVESTIHDNSIRGYLSFIGPSFGGFLYDLGGFNLPFFVVGCLLIFSSCLTLALVTGRRRYNRRTQQTVPISIDQSTK